MRASPLFVAVALGLTAAVGEAAPPTPPAEVRIGPDGKCPAPRRCWVLKEIRGSSLEVHHAGPDVRIEFGGTMRKANSDFDLVEPRLSALLPQLQGQMSELGRGQASVVVPFVFHFADGSRVRGEVVVGGQALSEMLSSELARVDAGPVALAGDGPEPEPAKPRAMWTPRGGNQTFMGKAATPNEIDWVLLVDGVERRFPCPGDRQGVAFDERGRVYERRTGALVGEKVFRSLDPPCVGALGVIDPARAAQWAWHVLRHQRKKPVAP